MTSNVHAPRILSIKQAALKLSVSTRTVARLAAAGKIKTVRVSTRRIGIPVEEVARIAEHGVST